LPQPTLPALPPGAVRVNAIAAVVNNDIITTREVLRDSRTAIEDARKKGPVDDNAERAMRKAVLERLIDKRLTDQKIKELGIKIGDDEIRQSIDEVKKQNNNMSQQQLEAALKSQGYTFEQYEKQIREQLERLRLVSMEVRSKVYVSAREVEDYYNANRDKFAEEEVFRARHIFIRINDRSHPEDIKAAMAKALDILHEAKSGKNFEQLAREKSDDPTAKKDGGDLGSFKRGEMLADLEQAIMPLKPGEVGELVSTPSGLHIVKLEEKNTGKIKSFDKVKGEIEETLYRKKQDERFANWMKDLRAKASVEIKDTQGLI
jgi:peptidyl-prolyl cis-trans isomerase SurA